MKRGELAAAIAVSAVLHAAAVLAILWEFDPSEEHSRPDAVPVELVMMPRRSMEAAAPTEVEAVEQAEPATASPPTGAVAPSRTREDANVNETRAPPRAADSVASPVVPVPPRVAAPMTLEGRGTGAADEPVDAEASDARPPAGAVGEADGTSQTSTAAALRADEAREQASPSDAAVSSEAPAELDDVGASGQHAGASGEGDTSPRLETSATKRLQAADASGGGAGTSIDLPPAGEDEANDQAEGPVAAPEGTAAAPDTATAARPPYPETAAAANDESVVAPAEEAAEPRSANPGGLGAALRAALHNSPAMTAPTTQRGTEESSVPASYAQAVRSAVAPGFFEAMRTVSGSGTVVVAVVIRRDGKVMSARVVQGSGNPALDAASLSAARGAPYPPLPRDVERSALTVHIPLRVR